MKKALLALGIVAAAILAASMLASGCNTGTVTHDQQVKKQKALESTIDPKVDGPHEKRPG